MLVLLQPDLGTSLVLAGILAGMLFMSGASLRWLAVLAAVIIAAVPIAWTYILRDYQKQRLLSFLDPSADPQGSGYQLLQSQIAVGSGGSVRQGPHEWDPEPRATSSRSRRPTSCSRSSPRSSASWARCVVFGLFVALIWRILLTAWRSHEPFGLCIAAGIASMLLVQVVINVGMVIGVMPITGIPLPFITHGGASLISIAVGLGILQSINIRQTRAEW